MLKRALNDGRLPAGYYALAEQIAGGLGPDVLTLDVTPSSGADAGTNGPSSAPTTAPAGIALATAPPPVQFTAAAEMDHYARKRNRVVIRHSSGHRVVALLEVPVSLVIARLGWQRLPATLAVSAFERSHVAQYWLSGKELKLVLYRETEGEPHGSVEISIETRRAGRDETAYAGTYRLLIETMEGSTDGAVRRIEGKGKVTCSAG